MHIQGAIEKLPDNLKRVNGNPTMAGCRNLKSLPDKLEVTGSANFNWCTSLESFPSGFKVGRTLYMIMSSVTHIPDGTTVGARLDASGCHRLESLPDGFTIIGGDVILRNCSRLESLPKGLKVGWNLDLTDCEKISELPDDIHVSSVVSMYGTKIADTTLNKNGISTRLPSDYGWVERYITRNYNIYRVAGCGSY